MRGLWLWFPGFAAPKSALADFGKDIADLGQTEIGGAPE
jgi:hypothetical protein